MAKSFKVKRGTYQRENIKRSGSINMLTSCDLELQEMINNNLMSEGVRKELKIPKVGVIGLGESGKKLCLKLRSKGIQVHGNDIDVEMSKEYWLEKLPNFYDETAMEVKPIWDYSRDLNNLVDQLKAPKAYPDGSPINRSTICFICTPPETINKVKSQLIPLLDAKDIVVDCVNKKVLLLINGDKSGFIKMEPLEIPFSCLEILLETFN